ncbi:type II and III secretion system protein [Schlesneria paludicola]|uniref:type II and III secretion system protein n=1 Tax=Schlesneria paludicola TaxID=360056 RepID=UPI00029B04D0|nr:type II and III secretion system protein [Schlesneria paludicola]
MLRPQSSFSKAQLAIALAIGVPLVMLMFAGLRARQLQSTANPRWAQFAKLSGPKPTSEDQHNSLHKTPVKTASLLSDEFSNSPPVRHRASLDFTGSVAGHSTIEMPVRAMPGTKSATTPEPAAEPEPPQAASKAEPIPQEQIPSVRQLILFRPIDEAQGQDNFETTVRLEMQLRDVGRRLDRLSQRQEELVRQRTEDAKKNEQRLRQAQLKSEKHESIAALRAWLKEDSQDAEPTFVAPRESISPREETKLNPDTSVGSHPAPTPRRETPPTIQIPPAIARSSSEPTAAPRIAAPQQSAAKQRSAIVPEPERTVAEQTPATPAPSAAHTFVEVESPDRLKNPAIAPPLQPRDAIRIEPSAQATDVFTMDVRDGDVREFFHRLSQTAHVSILVSPEVSGPITLSLRNVRLETALNAIAKSQGYVVEREGEITQISTIAEAAQLKRQKRTLVMRVYQPSFLSAAELNRLIIPLLSSDGRHSSSAVPDRAGDQTEDSDTAQRDVVIVQDVADIHDRIQQILVEMDVPPLQVEIEARILSVALPEAGPHGIDLRKLPCVPGANTLHCSSTDGELKQATLACSVPTFVNSVSSLGETQVLTTQRIQVLNKHRAEMLIGDRIGYQSCAGGAIQFLDSGTRLVFRPSISADGWIKLEVQPEHHSIQWDKRSKTPRQRTIEMSTHVMVPNAATLAIGGLITEQTIETTQRVPVVGAIPVVGSRFRHRQELIQRRELILLVTPHIVADCVPPSDAGPAVGLTHIRSPKTPQDKHSIDRLELARAHYTRATAYLHEGNTVKARQQIEASLHHNQHDAEAHRLRSAIDQSLAQYNIAR